MTYLKEFQQQIHDKNWTKFLQLWEEYCASDQLDVTEFSELLKSIKNSEFSKSFGKIVETALPLLQLLPNPEDKYSILKLLIDLETTNTPLLADLTSQALKERYGSQPQFQERMRMVGLRTRENFQGALTNYDLLSHMEKGNFVLHSGGWGTGEIIEISPIRQQVSIEFENVPGRKHFSFEHAFKALTPLQKDHFLVRRFADPDRLEQEATDDPVAIIKKLLIDLGPKTAGEIKEEMVDLVIPEKNWTKWWQNARTKLKKDPLVNCPEALKDPFTLRGVELSQEERLQTAMGKKTNVDDFIETAYNFLRDLPDARKHQAVREEIKEKLLAQLASPLQPEQELQLTICLDNYFSHTIPGKTPKEQILSISNIETVIHAINIIALKKRVLMLVREHRKDWMELFLRLMVSIKHSALREYILKELQQEPTKNALESFLKRLLQHPEEHPDYFVWYFQKVLESGKEKIPYSDKEGQCQFFDAFLVLMHRIENKSDYKDLTKKMYLLLSGKRYEIVRKVMEGASLEYVREFLLLASKCHTLSEHDRQILRSLAAVVHPILGKEDERAEKKDAHIIWTTENGYLRVQDQVKHIGTVEVIENAREIEAARALGDLRENSEYKFAVERRSRLQGQLKTLSDQLKRARILTKEDVSTEEVGVGNVVEVTDDKGQRTTYTILGPWEADAEKNILSFQSQLAQSMIGCKRGEKFKFRNEELKIANILSFFDK